MMKLRHWNLLVRWCAPGGCDWWLRGQHGQGLTGEHRLVVAACLDCRWRGCAATRHMGTHDAPPKNPHERVGAPALERLAWWRRERAAL